MAPPPAPPPSPPPASPPEPARPDVNHRQILDRVAGAVDIRAHMANWTRYSPFETLVLTVLSQNTTDVNSGRAFRQLRETMDVTPATLADAEQETIQEAIRTAGLHRQKSQRIKAIARTVHEAWDDDFDFLEAWPLAKARARLESLPGVGHKTADVVLNFVARRPIMPVDTHITRIARRIGLVPAKAGYERIRRALEALLADRDEIFTMHVSLIHFGRQTCKARHPRCLECPAAEFCPQILAKPARRGKR